MGYPKIKINEIDAVLNEFTKEWEGESYPDEPVRLTVHMSLENFTKFLETIQKPKS